MPPVNDDFANATVISGSSGAVTFSNVGAAMETGEPANAEGHSVWFKFTAPSDGTFSVWTSETPLPDWDSFLEVFIGSAVASLTGLATDDDSDLQPGHTDPFGTSRISDLAVNAGETYYIQVTAYDDVSGPVERADLRLAWAFIVPPPTLSSVNPTSGIAGTVVSLVGTGFTGVTDVRFGAASAVFTIVSDTHITATVPVTSVASDHVAVEGPGGSDSALFTVLFPGPWIQPPDATFTSVMTTIAGGQDPPGIEEWHRNPGTDADFDVARETRTNFTYFSRPDLTQFDTSVHCYGGLDGDGNPMYEIEQFDLNLDFNNLRGLDFASPTLPPGAVAVDQDQDGAPTASRLPWITPGTLRIATTFATNAHHPVAWNDGTADRVDEGLTPEAASLLLAGSPNFVFPHIPSWRAGSQLVTDVLLATETIAATFDGTVTVDADLPVTLLPIAAYWPTMETEDVGPGIAPEPLYPFVQLTVTIDRQVTGVPPGTSPTLPPSAIPPNPSWFAEGAEVVLPADAALAVTLTGTYTPPRYRFLYATKKIAQRQFPRDDGLGMSAARSWPTRTSTQSGIRRGPNAIT